MSDFKHLQINGSQSAAKEPTTSDAFKSASGVSNVQLGGAPDAHLPYVNRQPEVRVHTGVQRAVVNGDQITVTEMGTSRNIAGEASASTSAILASAHSQSGSKQSPSSITLDSIVRLPSGQEVRVKELVDAGVLRKLPSGEIIDPAASTAPQPQLAQQQQQAEQQQQEQDQPTEALADVAVEQELTNLVNTTSAHSQLTAINAIASGQGVTEAMINDLANASGQTPVQVTEFIERFHGAMTQQAADAVKKATGMSLDELASMVSPDELAGAIRAHIMNRNTSEYVALARRATENLDIASPDEVLAALKESGIPARTLPSGRIVVTIPGRGQLEFRTALRMGYIGPVTRG
jgi:hypothetical protein